MAIKIALVEDNRVNRHTFSRKMSAFQDLEPVFIAGNGQDALHRLKELDQSDRPGIMFVDIEMPLMNGIQFIQLAKVLYPGIYFIILTIFDDEEKIFEAIRAGANGYLLKDDTAEALRNAITDVLELGGAPMSPPIARKVMALLGRRPTKDGGGLQKIDGLQKDGHGLQTIDGPQKDGHGLQKGGDGPQKSVQQNETASLEDLLSEREQEIILYMIKGSSPRQIAEHLFISLTTVRKHIANIYKKLHVNTNTQIMNLAYRNNWI
jgi:DNA-binding NarL/FixJ family response regulator